MSELRAAIESIQTFETVLNELLSLAKEYGYSIDSKNVSPESRAVLPHVQDMIATIEKWDESKKVKESFGEFIDELNNCVSYLVGNVSVLYIAGRPTDKVAHEYKSKLKEITDLLSSDLIEHFYLLLDFSSLLYKDFGIDKKNVVESCKNSLDDINEIKLSVINSFNAFNEYIAGIPKKKSEFIQQMSNATDAVTVAATRHIGSTIASAYRLNAQKENKLADLFRIGSIGCFVISAMIILYGFWNNTAVPGSVVELIYRAGPILFFTVPAFYLARESNSHRAVQRKFQHLALNLPIGIKYIRGLDENNRRLIEAEFAKHLLMYSENSMANTNPSSSAVNNDDLSLRTILSELKAAVENIPKP